MGGNSHSKLTYQDDSKHTTSAQTITQSNHAPSPLDQPAMECAKFPLELDGLVAGFLAYDVQISPATSSHTIFHNSEVKIYQDAVAIARDDVLPAGPLDALEAKVRANRRVLLPRIRITQQISGVDHTFEGTLEQLAIINLDNTIKSNEGMAERLRTLRAELLPETMPLALVQARLASPIKDEKEAKIRQDAQKKVLNDVFERIKEDDSNNARTIMGNYIASTMPTVITNNRYFLNLLQFIPMAFKLLDRVHPNHKSSKIPSTKDGNLKNEQLYGYQEDQYCFVTIGVIDAALSFASRRALTNKLDSDNSSGLYGLLCEDKKLNRSTDVSDKVFAENGGIPRSTQELGVDYFYNNTGQPYFARPSWGPTFYMKDHRLGVAYQNLYQTITSASLNLHAAMFYEYRKAAEQNNATAQFKLGLCYEKGLGIEKDKKTAVHWYRKAAEQNHLSAQINLGSHYLNGSGVEKDKKAALSWYHKAADRNHAVAQYNLGVCYEKGLGTEKDEKAAVSWYRKAANQNHANAQFKLGMCYENGTGILKNENEALLWYEKAATQNHEKAIKKISLLHERLRLSSSSENNIHQEVNRSAASPGFR